MTEMTHRPQRLDVRAFARQAAQLQGQLLPAKLQRLAPDLLLSHQDAAHSVRWQARGQAVTLAGGASQAWLHLEVVAHLPVLCQRCLSGFTQEIHVQRSFRFVRDEQEANAQDETAAEDLLVASKQFNLLDLIEDEIIMALPFAPVHEQCPSHLAPGREAEDGAADALDKPRPFAVLGQFKGG